MTAPTPLPAEIEADRAAGTPGPWRWQNEDECLVGPDQVVMRQDEEGRKTFVGYMDGSAQANARRIARVPEMEDRIIADAAHIAALEARVKELEEALLQIDAMDPEGRVYGYSISAIQGLVLRMGETARRALNKEKADG